MSLPPAPALPLPAAATRPGHTIPDAEALLLRVCLRVAPLWGLRDLVAVNPYLGYAGSPLLDAEEALQRRQHAAVLPDWDILRFGWQAGEFTRDDLAAARAELADGDAPGAAAIAGWLADPGHAGPPSARCLSIAGVLSAGGGVDWAAAAAEDLGRFLAARTDQGVGRWPLPDRGGLWPTWQAWMAHDRSMAVRGLGAAGGARLAAWIAALPSAPEAAFRSLLERLPLPAAAWDDYLGRLLGELPGWAGWLRQEAWAGGQTALGELPALLAARLALDLALREALGRPGVLPRIPATGADPQVAADRQARLVAVAAWERAWRRTLEARFSPVPSAPPSRPALQGVFCIDVRSEGLRQAAEVADPGFATLGFAGFFAMPVGVDEGRGAVRAQCPVLLAPGPAVRLAGAVRRLVPGLLASFRRSAGGGFAYMETAGPGRAAGLLLGTLRGAGAARSRDETAPLDLSALSRERRLALLQGLLANLGLGPVPARLVLLCGHDSTVANNPQGAAFACGACGGHSGAVNARLAAALYNDPVLRAAGGGRIPGDSIAVAGVHDTATDEVRLLDPAAIPTSHREDLARLERALAAAGAAQRRRRAPALAGLPAAAEPRALHRAFAARARDWCELRPEWGLAGCAAFIAAPRAMTRGRDLEGRCFLHSYDASQDPTGDVLALILTAPVVVASWISLQYWGSTVDPGHLGSGDKALHTIVGGLGVATGGGGDLRTGLSRQSVHDGAAPRHRPHRLQVYVAAAPAAMDRVVADHAHLGDLVRHGWIALHAVDPATGAVQRRRPAGGWTA